MNKSFTAIAAGVLLLAGTSGAEAGDSICRNLTASAGLLYADRFEQP